MTACRHTALNNYYGVSELILILDNQERFPSRLAVTRATLPEVTFCQLREVRFEA